MDTSSDLGDEIECDRSTVCPSLDVNNEETQVEMPVETMEFNSYDGLMSGLLRDVEIEINHGKEQFRGVLNKLILVSETIAAKKHQFVNRIQNVVNMTHNFSAEVESIANEAAGIAAGHHDDDENHFNNQDADLADNDDSNDNDGSMDSP